MGCGGGQLLRAMGALAGIQNDSMRVDSICCDSFADLATFNVCDVANILIGVTPKQRRGLGWGCRLKGGGCLEIDLTSILLSCLKCGAIV